MAAKRGFAWWRPALGLALCVLMIGTAGGWLWARSKRRREVLYPMEHQPGERLTVKAQGNVLWQLNFNKAEGKPYFHPVCTPGGPALTWLRPADHRWHRAIWFSWKHINGLNYWEENRQGLSQGRTEVVGMKFQGASDRPATIFLDIEYHPPGKPAVLKERRTIRISLPDKDGCYRMDWQSVFTAQDQEVLLDRTKIKAEGGPAWGGYAGLSYRAAQSMSAYQVLNSEGHKDMAAHGKPARWLDFSGVVDPKTKKAAGVAMFDHPTNPRHPTPWYVAAQGKFGYFGPAFLFDKSHRLPAGKTLKLTYRILIHPGRGSKEQLEKEYRDFIARKDKKSE